MGSEILCPLSRLFSTKRLVRKESKVQVLRRRQKDKSEKIAARQNEHFERLQEALSMDEEEQPDAIQSAQELATETISQKMTLYANCKESKQNRARFLPLFKQGSILLNHFGLKTAFDYEGFPFLTFPGDINVIHSDIEEDAFASVLQNVKIVGIDTECRPRFDSNKANNPVSLIQISTIDTVYLYRIKRQQPLPPLLGHLLASPHVIKVGHSLRDDCKSLRESKLVERVSSTLDTLPIAKRLGCSRPGLKTLCQIFLDHNLSKKMQLSDWESPDLSVKQIQYAATDAWAPLLVILKMLQFKEARDHVRMKTYGTDKSNKFFRGKSNPDCFQLCAKRCAQRRSQSQFLTQSTAPIITTNCKSSPIRHKANFTHNTPYQLEHLRFPHGSCVSARSYLAINACYPLRWKPYTYHSYFTCARILHFNQEIKVSPTSTSLSSSSAIHKNPAASTETTAESKKKIAAARRRRSKLKAQEQKLVNALEKGGERVLLRVENLDQQIPKVQQKVLLLLKRTPQLARDGFRALGRGIYIVFREPQTVALYWGKLKEKIKKELHHYWLGTKLLCADTTTSTRIIRRVLHGNAISRRERKQLQRTVADLLRLVPFAFFLVVPFMELLLPVALKIFPNMLPSTFKDSFQREEDMKRQLQLRVSLAEFLQETVKEVMQDTRDTEGVSEEQKASASEVMNFVDRAQRGQPVTAEETLKVAKMFNDELMLDNISRPQLVAMCRYMGVQHYGNDNLLRFQLRNRLRQLKKDDQDIIWEGLDSLNREELQQACMERGMRATGLTKAGYIRQMKQWLDLSINKNVPASLLIMSRALNITVLDNPEAALATSMSSMDEEVVTEVALAASSEKESHKLTKLKLDSIRYQNEMIADEEKYRTEVKKKAHEEASAAEAVAEEATATIQDIMKESDGAPSPSKIPAVASAGMLLDGKLDELAKKQAEQAEISAAEEAATSKETPSTSAKSVEKIISLEALSALESLAFKSIVEKERQALDQMKQNKSEMDVESLLAAGRIGARFRENKTAGRMMKKLEAMLSNLEVELDKVDRDVGDRLNILDRDSDGVLSAEELKHAVMTIMRKSNREEDVEWLVTQIDEDQDGRISLEKLVEWISKSRESLEATGQISLESADGTEAP
uniref:Mitochondrial proton/calcium exchanger protein n=1 Tax=Albugo laibachii Nc14 TaxID=890382 RepID=F0W288_9STRA|nr:LETM1 and EFhand domaincontaining protein 1 putative [Albugo laibachii Nc14]|eukprot:CCA15173.1 LETM1 and EFhand domaincontaining protein 1 putative [Albugo laibachii Nc14]